MAKGLPKAIAKKYGITKKAWAVYRGQKRGRKKTRRKSTKKKTTRRRRSNPKSNSRRKKKLSLPIALLGGVAAGFMVKPTGTWYSPFEAVKAGRLDIAVNNYLTNMIGYRPDTGRLFDTQIGMKGLGALIAGVLVHKFVGGSPLNVNRSLAAAGIPIIRI